MQGCPPLTKLELKRALAHLRGRHRWRNRALVILGVRSGLRISELLSLRNRQVWTGQAIPARFYLERQDTKGRRSGASLIMHPQAAAAIKKWMDDRGPAHPDDFLFPSQRCPDQPFDRRWAWRLLNRAFRAAGVSGKAGTHALRKTFARNVHEALGRDLVRTSKALRHSSPLTTLAYLSFDQAEIDRGILAA